MVAAPKQALSHLVVCGRVHERLTVLTKALAQGILAMRRTPLPEDRSCRAPRPGPHRLAQRPSLRPGFSWRSIEACCMMLLRKGASMKKAALLMGLVAVLCACTTAPPPVAPEERIIQQVFEVDRPKDELFDLAMEWVAKTFRSAQAVIQYQDREAGKIVGKGNMAVTYVLFSYPTYFTLTIEIKDGRVRATVEDAYILVDFENEVPIRNVEQMKRFKPKVLELFMSLEGALKAEQADW